jgi:hypothetical protein
MQAETWDGPLDFLRCNERARDVIADMGWAGKSEGGRQAAPTSQDGPPLPSSQKGKCDQVPSLLDMGLVAVPVAAATEPGAPCPGHAEALGTSRVLAVDPTVTPRVGRKHFPTTLALADKEVVLTS